MVIYIPLRVLILQTLLCLHSYSACLHLLLMRPSTNSQQMQTLEKVFMISQDRG